MWFILLLACQPKAIDPYETSGSAAKGPLIQGSSVSIAPIDASGSPSGEVYPTATRSDLGDFATRIAFTGAVRAEATGFFWSEARLDLSQAPITIRGIGEVAPNGPPLQVNVLTHLIEPRVTALMDEGSLLAIARSSAQDEVVAALGIGSFDPDAWDASAIGLYDGDNDLSAYLFAVSSTLANAAGNGTSADAELQSLLNQIGSDLADDGQIEATLAARVEQGMLTLDVDAVAQAFGSWSAARGSTVAVPDMYRVLPDFDADGDGHLTLVCVHTDLCSDCNDQDAAVNPDAAEVPYDGVDQDCNGSDLVDVDGDGFAGGAGGEDCNDTDPAVNLEAVEVWYDGIDQDCAGDDDFDQDGDGDPSDQYGGEDCDDEDGATGPHAVEIWYDGTDQDCDGLSDFDMDKDGFDADVYGGDDCDDHDPTVNEAATYEGDDPNCIDGDLDGDPIATDCDDLEPSVFSGAPEICDGQQNDCSLSSWSPSLEDGLVTRMSDRSDVTELFSDGQPEINLHGGEYLFCNGTWDVRLSIYTEVEDDDAHVVIRSLNGPEFTILDGGGSGVWSPTGGAVVIYVGNGSNDNTTVEVDGFTIRGGYNGAQVNPSSTLRVRDSVFTGNYGDSGGGIAAWGLLEVTDTIFTDNRGEHGAGVAVRGATAHATLVRTTFTGNNAGYGGGGLVVSDNATAELTDCIFDHNQDDLGPPLLGGDAIHCFQGCNLLVEDSVISNHVGGGSAVFVGSDLVGSSTEPTFDSVVEIVDTEMSGNGGVYGGALDLLEGTTTLLRSSIRESQGQSAVWLREPASLTCIESAIAGNDNDLGAVLLWGPDAFFDVQGCDMGGGTDDNAPVDIFIEGPDTSFDYGADATFTCTNGTCSFP